MGCQNSRVTSDERNKHRAMENSARSISESHKHSLHLEVGDGNTSVKTLTFRHVMQDPMGRMYFMMFLKKEHAEENLIFYESVENVKKMGSDELTNAANELVASYLIPGVETEVNISDQMKRNIISMADGNVAARQEEFIKQLERAQNEVMMILAMGAFPRFMKSNYFVQYKIKSKQQRDAEARNEDIREPERA